MDGIAPGNAFDAKYVAIYKLRIQEIVYDSLSVDDMEDLNEIARDFADSSMANVLALAMFDLCSEDPYPDYLRKCEPEPYLAQPLFNSSPHTDDLVEWHLNPVTDIIDNQYNYHYFDLAGHEINLQGSPQDHLKGSAIPANFSPGLYICIESNVATGEIVRTGKFVILH